MTDYAETNAISHEKLIEKMHGCEWLLLFTPICLDQLVTIMWAHCGADSSTQCHRADRGWVRGCWHWLVPNVFCCSFCRTQNFTPVLLSFFHLSFSQCLCCCCWHTLIPSHLQSILERFSLLWDFILHLWQQHSQSSFPSPDGVSFLGKQCPISATYLNDPFSCISCFILSHSLSFQLIIVAATSPNAVTGKQIQISKIAFAFYFKWLRCVCSTCPTCQMSPISHLSCASSRQTSLFLHDLLFTRNHFIFLMASWYQCLNLLNVLCGSPSFVSAPDFILPVDHSQPFLSSKKRGQCTWEGQGVINSQWTLIPLN